MTHHRSASPRRARLASSALALGLTLGLLGCEAVQPGSAEGGSEVRGDLERLRRRHPADIAVAPVRDLTGVDTVPRELMRTAFEEALVDRMYSPLSADYVDANWVEASFRGTPSPDALLMVVIDGYDASGLYSSGVVEITGEVVLYEGADTTGHVLWSASLDEAIDLGQGRRGPPTPSETHIPEAVRRFARTAMETLPARDPIEANR